MQHLIIFFSNYKKFDRIFLVWFIIIAIVAIDIYLEAFTGKSMTGYYSNSLKIHNRVYSFFIDEAKVGGFIGCFFLILTGYFLNFYHFKLNKWKYLIVIISIFFIIAIILTGERTNSIHFYCIFYVFH